jgi:hypothetical protein
VSSGKSTLVNALLRQRVAPTDVSECTRYVTVYRYGVPERVEVVLRDGQRHGMALMPDGTLPRSPSVELTDVTATRAEEVSGSDGGASSAVARLEVHLGNDALRELVLIDTPGLGSLDGQRSAETTSLLGIDHDSRAAVADADALVFVLTSSLRGDEAELLRSFHEVLGRSTASALGAVCVLNKADLVDDEGDDTLAVARSLAARYADVLGDAVAEVRPLMSLIAESVDTGRFTEANAVALRALASLPDATRRAALLSADRFTGSGVPLAADDRKELLDVLGLRGVVIALDLVESGMSTASALMPELRALSGIEGLRLLLLDVFARDADALKASGALAALERLSYAMTDPQLAEARAQLHDDIDAVRLEPSMHRLAELRALNEVTSGAASLPGELELDLRRVVAGTSSAERLGLPASARHDEIQRAAAGAASAWKRFRNDGRSSPGQQWIADVMTQSCERLWFDAAQSAEAAAGND